MKQKSLFQPKAFRREHGGALSVKKRRSRRPLSTKEPHHVTLRSDFARGSRSLLRHRPRIDKIIKNASHRFQVRIYERAICGNHLHLLVSGKRREYLQNFFRVVAGHIAQEILRRYPLIASTGAHPGGAPRNPRTPSAPDLGEKEKAKGHPKNQRKFWALLLYSRVVRWGKDFKQVKKYVVQNTLEALGLITYQPRKPWLQKPEPLPP